MISPDASEILAIREALEAAGVPEPFGRGQGHTAAWVRVALAELARVNGQLRERKLPAPRPAPIVCSPDLLTPAQVADRHEVAMRVKSRHDRTDCPRPDKDAYDTAREDERALANRRRGPGMAVYKCGCGWSHVGHPTPADILNTAVLPDEPRLWARTRRRVCLYNGHGQPVESGRVVAYEYDPTVQIETEDRRRVTWRADMARAVDDQQTA